MSAVSGSIAYNGQQLENYKPIELRRQVLLVSQLAYLFDKSIKENFEEFYTYRNLPVISDDEINEYLKICCINFTIDSSCSNMSGGERQRVYLAICISFLPKVLMLDEPTSALDDKNAKAVLQNIKDFSIQNDITLIVVSHNNSLASSFADNIITLRGCAMK